MKSNSLKKFLTPLIVTLLCVVVLFSGVYCSISIAKNTPLTDGNNNTPSNPSQGNTIADPLPDDHYVKLADEEYQYNTGTVKKGYNNDDQLTDVFEIRTKSDLQSWLLTPENAFRDAKLMNDIVFNWDYSASDPGSSVGNNNDGLLLLDEGRTRYKPVGLNNANSQDGVAYRARISGGRILEGMGYKITYDKYYLGGLTHATGYFTYEIYGSLRNLRFETTANLRLNNTSNGYTYHNGFLAHELMSGGEISNVKVVLGDNMGADPQGKKDSTCNVYVGGFVGKSSGVIKDSEMALGANGAFYAWAGHSNKATRAYLGGFVGEAMSSSALLLRCVLDLNNRGADGIKPFATDTNKNFIKNGGGAYGSQNGGRVEGLIVKNHNVSVPGFSNFIGKPGIGYLTGLYLQNNNNIGNECGKSDENDTSANKTLPYVRTETSSGLELFWDKTAADSSDISKARLVVKRNGMAADNIYWSLLQMDNGILNKKVSPDMYRYDINMSKRLSIPVFNPSTAKEDGDTFKIFEGRVGKIKDISFHIENNQVAYTGRSYPVTLELSSRSDENEIWTNDLSVIRYSGKTLAPSLPGIYITTIRATTPPVGQENSFALFDAESRRLVWVDDDLTREKATLNILKGEVLINAALNMDFDPAIPYVDDTWTSKAVIVNLRIYKAATAEEMTEATKPDTIKLTTHTKEYQALNPNDNSIWIEEKAWTTNLGSSSSYRLSKVHQGVPYRFALFKGAMQLTEITDAGLLPKVDEVDPTIRLNASHDDAKSIKYLGNWFDRYNANKNDTAECAQLWVDSTFGASELEVQVRKKRVGAVEFDNWGVLEYIPHDGDLYYNSIFAQRFYDDQLTRAQNHAKYGGEWIIQIRAKSGANKWAEVTISDNSSKLIGADYNEQMLQTQVKVDYSDYTIDDNNFTRYWNGSNADQENLDVLDKETCTFTTNYPADRNYFFRNEAMTFTVKTSEPINNLGYSLVSVNGVDVPTANKQEYKGSYTMPNSDAIGAVPVIKANIKKIVYGNISNIDSNTYGNAIPNFVSYLNLEKANVGGVDYDFVTTPSLTNSKGEVVADITNIRMPKGTYTVKIAAELQSDEHKKMYEAEVSSNTFTIVAKEITLEFVSSTLSCSYRNFTPSWVKVVNFDSQVVEGDTLKVLSISPDQMPPSSEIELGPVVVDCKVKLNNDNYYCNSIAKVTLAKFLTDSEDSSVYLIESADDFMDIKDGFLTAKFKQINNIDFGARAIKSINEFTGVYNGNGYSISNFKLITKASKTATVPYNIGLFSSIKNATVKNLIIRDVVVEYTGNEVATSNVGIVAGKAVNSTIDNVLLHGAITVNGIANTTTALNIGTVVGLANDITLKDSLVVANMNVISTKLNDKQINANVGGFIGSVTGDTNAILYSKIIVQGILNTSGVAGQFVGNNENVALTSLTHMKNALTLNGEVMANVEGSSSDYLAFVNDKTMYGEITDGQSTSRGVAFSDILKRLVPSSMIVAGDIKVLKVSNFRDLLRMSAVSWANYEITNDIYCFIGYDYNDNQRYIGNIINNGGYKIYSDNGVFDIGAPMVK